MNNEKPKFTWEGLGGLATFAAFIVGCIWTVSDIKQVQAKHEARIDSNTVAIVEVKKDLEHENDNQDSANLRFQGQVDQRLDRMEDKLDKVYDVVKVFKQ